MKDKFFHDTVHGTIKIPEEYCKHIIDTLLFQRLRRVEQTSMRSLYPCAHHDRFIHSIGVFYIGSMLVQWLELNIKKELFKELSPYWDKVVQSYKIACLLHDVGHAPFSHTFEKYYDIGKPQLLNSKLLEVINSETLELDITLSPPPKPHEKVSAYLLASEFKDAVVALGGDPEMGARMITGYKYHKDASIVCQLANCFIEVLHGEVDADRLDYVVRDQWAAGLSSARIQIERLLRSVLIIREKESKKLKFCFTKNAINQIESLAQIKNYQNKWVFRHQNVIYDQHVLKLAIEKVATIFGNKAGISKEEALSRLFNIECFTNPNYQFDNQNLYLLSDDTIMQLIRQTFNENEYAQEWLSRRYVQKTLWKTLDEFDCLFKNNKEVLTLKKISAKFNELDLQEGKDFFVKEVDCSNYSVVPNTVWICIDDKLYDVVQFLGSNTEKSSTKYYVYLSQSKKELEKDLIQQMQGIV